MELQCGLGEIGRVTAVGYSQEYMAVGFDQPMILVAKLRDSRLVTDTHAFYCFNFDRIRDIRLSDDGEVMILEFDTFVQKATMMDNRTGKLASMLPG